MADHSPGRITYDADWRELRLHANGCVIGTLTAPHPKCRGKERLEELEITQANGERIVALWNSACDSSRIERLIAACEGELDGLAVSPEQAARILAHVDGVGDKGRK